MTAVFIHNQPNGLRLLVHLIRFLTKGIGSPIRVGNFRRVLCKTGDINVPDFPQIAIKVHRFPHKTP
jgi:hypothetical protein